MRLRDSERLFTLFWRISNEKIFKIGLVVATCALILFVFVLVRLLFLPTVSNTKKIEDYGQFRLYSN